MRLNKTLAYYIREKFSAFMIGLTLIMMYAILFPFISSNLCVGVYDETEGLIFNNTVVSTFFSRYLDQGYMTSGVVHTYLTLSDTPSESVIVNFHIAGSS